MCLQEPSTPTDDLLALLQRVASGGLEPEAAATLLRSRIESGLGFARLDLDRTRRCAVPEVVFAPGKHLDHLLSIAERMLNETGHVMVTRVTPEQARALCERLPEAVWHELARCVTADRAPLPEPGGQVAVVAAGTADLPVAEEAAITSERMGCRVERVWDVGVAGLHRLWPHLDRLRASRVVVVVAGMEGALPSVVGGLIPRPVIAVPTSVGYGVHMNGLAPLLAMLNSCVPGVTVVNIDNGFGAGVAAGLINRVGTP